MERKCIIKKIDDIISSTLNHHDYVMCDSLTPSEVNGWDSLVNAVIITTVEKDFNIKFKFVDLTSWRNIGELITIIQSKQG